MQKVKTTFQYGKKAVTMMLRYDAPLPSPISHLLSLPHRQGLREGPTQELRKTCRKLEKYLPADQLDPFKKTYAVHKLLPFTPYTASTLYPIPYIYSNRS